ncbi:SMI1/KNR4 family protein [Fimbriiglobus ruber]|uniref:SMI1/KNR4 family protein n=1 Tax=Fimbriiglobus ruber TaxID=1908690 RepID=UPI000B4B12AE|nr:SMI1/KNR4 family protein [Fimbriiglobus ruber]
MDCRVLFETVRRHLNLHGITCEVETGSKVTEKILAKAESETKIRLPGELREFYTTIGNGFSFFWNADANDPNSPFGSLLIPTLADLVSLYHGWREVALYTPEKAEAYEFPYTDDPRLAKQTAARMWFWLPIIQEGNGDLICIDLAVPNGPVVFHRHDWLDGGTGDDGHLLAPSWRMFLTSWASVCFQLPNNLYWPSSFTPGGGVAWDGEQFRDPYRIPGLV